MPAPNGPQFQMTPHGQGMTVAPPPVEYEDDTKKVATAGSGGNPPDDNPYMKNMKKDKKNLSSSKAPNTEKYK